ncbi:MAG: hypothetical protein H6742_08310 [Alphaproteobacteria bacterium]|nr:hypothetical protein [Alphaproteobacteria bacterium]
MVSFYDDHVRLQKPDRDQLAGYRDLNLGRLNSGLDALEEETGEAHPHYKLYRNQGSYAMLTLNKHADGDYDIDVAVIFRKEDLPEVPADARKRVRDALLKKCTNFSKEPEARTNAVTIWYSQGYHVDFAVYRVSTDFWGEAVIEHASGDEWKARDPDAVTSWFEKTVSDKNPGSELDKLFGIEVGVEPEQFRRVVALLKAFCKSRSGWSLPGGMIISALVAETYQRDVDRDDVAFYATLVALRDRLNGSCAVFNPIDSSEELTQKPRRLAQVERLLERLDKAVDDLAILHEADCTEKQARSAWKKVFNHSFWAPVEEEATKAAVATSQGAVYVECGMAAKTEGRPYAFHRSNGAPMPRGVHLKFRVTHTSVAPPYVVRWTVNNDGDEALAADDMGHVQERDNGDSVYWTSSCYKGRHTMTCEIIKGGAVAARAVHVVRISGSGRRRK